MAQGCSKGIVAVVVAAAVLVATASPTIASPSAAASGGVRAQAGPGEVDAGFGTGGSTSVPGASADAVAVDGGGRTVVASTDTAARPPTVSITRLGPEGRPDPTFATSGSTTSSRRGFGYPDDLAVAVDAAGRPVLAAIEERAGRLDLVLRRLTADGAPDDDFGGGEVVVALPSTIADVATVGGLVVGPDGHITVGVVWSRVDPNAATVARLGVLLRFDGGGDGAGATFSSLTAEARATGVVHDRLAVDADGRLLHAEVRSGVVTVRRYAPDLAPDAGFGTGGSASVPTPAGGSAIIGDVVLAPSGRSVLVAGGPSAGGGAPFVVRLTDAGTVDAGWSGGGTVAVGEGTGPVVDVVALRDGGAALVTAAVDPAAGGRVHRFDRAGRADPALGGTAGVSLIGLSPGGPVGVVGDRLLVPGVTGSGPVVRALTLGQASLPAAPAAPVALARGAGTVDLWWRPPAGSAAASGAVTGYVVTAWSGSTVVRTVPADETTSTLTDLGDAAALSFTVAAVSDAGTGPASEPSRVVVAAAPDGGPGEVLVSVEPCRVLDTRFAGGPVTAALRSASVRDPSAIAAQGGRAGGCGIPADASAVFAAVSAVTPTGTGYLRAGAGTAAPPTTTFVNFGRSSVTNVGVLSLGGPGDDVGLQAFVHPTHVVVDVFGYSIPRTAVSAGEGAVFVPVSPCRVADDRVSGARLLPGTTSTVAVGGDLAAQGGRPGGCGIPDDAIAVELAVSSVEPTVGGYARLGPAGTPLRATVLNVTAGSSATTTSHVGLGRSVGGDPSVDLLASGLRSSWVVDVTGYQRSRTTVAEPAGTVFHPATPCRLADTRRAGGPVAAGGVLGVEVVDAPTILDQGGAANGCAVPAEAAAVHVTVSAVDPRGTGHVRLGPTGRPAPAGTVLQFRAGTGSTGSASIEVADGGLDVHVAGGATDVVVELQGWYEPT